MHEYSLARTVIARAEAEARARGALRVNALTLRVGELSGVEPDLLAGAFELAREGSLAAAATLRVERIRAAWNCPRCRAELPRGGALHCARCDVPAELAEGSDALTLASIELEVP